MLDPTATFGLFPLFMLVLLTLFTASVSLDTGGPTAERRPRGEDGAAGAGRRDARR